MEREAQIPRERAVDHGMCLRLFRAIEHPKCEVLGVYPGNWPVYRPSCRCCILSKRAGIQLSDGYRNGLLHYGDGWQSVFADADHDYLDARGCSGDRVAINSRQAGPLLNADFNRDDVIGLLDS